MKFSTKLIVSFTGITLLLISIGGISQYLNNQFRNRIFKESEKAVEKLNLSGEMGLQLYRSLINIQYFLEDRYRKSLSTDKREADINTQKAEQQVDRALSTLKTNLDNFRQLADSTGSSLKENREILEKLNDRFEIYGALIDELLVLAKNSHSDGKEFFTVTIEPYFRSNLLPLVDRLRDQTQENLDREITYLNEQLKEAGTFLIFATGGAVLLSILLTVLLYRSVAYPLKDLSVAAQHIGAGNLDERISIDSNDEIGDLAAEFNRMAENLSKITVSKNFMNDIIESMKDALIVTDGEGNIQRINGSALNMLGYEREEARGRPLETFFVGDANGEEAKILSDGTREGSLRTSMGETIPVSYSIAPIHDGRGAVQGKVCVAGDISRRKEAEKKISDSLKEKEVLLAEIHHRVKNNLAVISGLLQMQIWETDDETAEGALKDSQMRVQSIALIHEKLYQSDKLSYIQFDRYISGLLDAIERTYRESDSEVSVDIKTELESVALNITQAIPCSLLLNELIVNAYKYAFGEQQKGTIHIRLQKPDEEVHLEVADDGMGLPEDYSKGESSLGLSLVRTLVEQLEGDLEINNSEGVSFSIRFKAASVA